MIINDKHLFVHIQKTAGSLITNTLYDVEKTHYTDKDVEKVYNMYKRDIEYFNYEF
jgi:hypothetical protein